MILSLLIAGAVRGTSGAVFSPLSRAPSPTCTLFLFSPPTHRAQAGGPGGRSREASTPSAVTQLHPCPCRPFTEAWTPGENCGARTALHLQHPERPQSHGEGL